MRVSYSRPSQLVQKLMSRPSPSPCRTVIHTAIAVEVSLMAACFRSVDALNVLIPRKTSFEPSMPSVEIDEMCSIHANKVKYSRKKLRSSKSKVLSPRVAVDESRKEILSCLWKTATCLALSNSLSLKNTNALEADQNSISRIAKIYDDGAATYDDYYSESIVSRTLDFATLRQSLLSYAQGAVLELGVGTGLNLQYYPNAKSSTSSLEAITSFCGIDISSGMLKRAKERMDILSKSNNQSVFAQICQQKANCPVQVNGNENTKNDTLSLQIADATHLPFVDNTFDTVVDTFSLCVFEEPVVVLKEAKRVLKPGGRLLLLEHEESLLGKVMSPTRSVASASDIAKTCRYNDNVKLLLKDADFSTFLLDQPKAGGFFRQIVAIKDR